MLIDLVMVTAPKPAESRQLISPEAAVFEIAPAKVLQGAVRLHGLTSSPTPETHVRVACAWAGTEAKIGANIPATNAINAIRRIMNLLCWAGFPALLKSLPATGITLAKRALPSRPEKLAHCRRHTRVSVRPKRVPEISMHSLGLWW